MLSPHVINMLRGSPGILHGHSLSHYWECGGSNIPTEKITQEIRSNQNVILPFTITSTYKLKAVRPCQWDNPHKLPAYRHTHRFLELVIVILCSKDTNRHVLAIGLPKLQPLLQSFVHDKVGIWWSQTWHVKFNQGQKESPLEVGH